MKSFTAKRLLPLLLLMSACGNQKEPLYTTTQYEVGHDYVKQGKYTAKVLGPTRMTSDYQSPANATYSRHIEFKFSLNGKDNELPFGVNHHLIVKPDASGQMVAPTITFGQPDSQKAQLPPDDPYLEPNTRLTLKLDLRPVLQAFETQGAYTGSNEEPLAAEDFKGVWIAGGAAPLSWDFENLPARDPFKLTDPDGDGIYELELVLNVYDEDNFTANSWELQADISQYPQLKSEIPLLEAMYNMSLEEMQANIRQDGAFMAGEKWTGVWTRDISYSIHLSLAMLAPEAAKTSLRAKVKDGRIIQDTGTGGSWPVSTDRMTWALAAWEVYLATGDESWKAELQAILQKSLQEDAAVAYNPNLQMVRGESSFLDWRKQSYPRWMEPRDIYESYALGTHTVHTYAQQIMGYLAPEQEQGKAAAYLKGLQTHLRVADGHYGQFVYGRLYPYTSPRYEALGTALLVVLGLPEREGERMVSQFPVTPYGTTCIYPQIPGIPPYHNDGIWPFVQAYWNWAASRTRNEAQLLHGMGALYRAAALFLTNKENMVGTTGDFEGTEINSDRQLWSVAGNLAMVYRILFGLTPTWDGLVIAPTVPQAYAGPHTLKGYKYHGASLNITVKGHGARVDYYEVDGNRMEANWVVPANYTGTHNITVVMKPGGWNKNGTLNIMPNAYAPATPVVRVEGEYLTWQPVEGATSYTVGWNGTITDTLTTTKWQYPTQPGEAVVIANNANGIASFMSQPIALNIPEIITEAERGNATKTDTLSQYSGSGFVGLDLTNQQSTALTLQVKEAGTYWLDARYSNGAGPVNTNNKCALRTLFINGEKSGVLVMPQRGFGEWSNWGYSNIITVKLPKGSHKLELRYVPEENTNMNGKENRAMLDHIRLRKVLP